MPNSEKFTGTFNGEEVSVFREFGGHRFTDEEVEWLLNGDVIEFPAHSERTGNDYTARGRLEKDGRFVKFKMDFDAKPDHYAFPPSLCGHTFSAEERDLLLSGQPLHRDDWYSKAKDKHFEADAVWSESEGLKFNFNND